MWESFVKSGVRTFIIPRVNVAQWKTIDTWVYNQLSHFLIVVEEDRENNVKRHVSLIFNSKFNFGYIQSARQKMNLRLMEFFFSLSDFFKEIKHLVFSPWTKILSFKLSL